jgi:hypothetical protein
MEQVMMIISVLSIPVLAISLALVFPIMAIVKCVKSNLSSKAKTLWIILMVFTWPLTNYIYFIKYSKTTAYRVLSVLAII